MLVRRLSQLLTTAVLAVAFVAFTAVSGGSVAKAQGRYHDHYRDGRYNDHNYQDRHQRREREALRRHQRAERYWYGNSRALRHHRQHERARLRGHQYSERFGYYDGDGRSRSYRRRY